MKGIFKVEYLGTESFKGKNDPEKEYHSLIVMQGTEVEKIFISSKQLQELKDLKKLDTINIILDITTSIRDNKKTVYKTYLGLAKS